MSTTKTTTHHDDGKEIERKETTRDDGSQRIVESEVTRNPLGRVGSNIVRETRVDPQGNSVTKNRR
jgi:hypothetical protein